MAFRPPRYSIGHAVYDAGIANVSIHGSSTVAAGFPLARLLDERRSVNFKFGESLTTHYVQINRLAGAFSINRLYIPDGHNFAGADIQLRASSSSDMSSPTTLIAATAAPAGAVDIEHSINTQQYLRLDWPNDAGQWEIPEWFSTYIYTPTRGTEPGWSDQVVANALTLEKANGEFPVVVTGPPQREFKFRYRRASIGDAALFDIMIARAGVARVFLFDPPFDTEAAILCRFVSMPAVRFDHPIPERGIIEKRYDVHVREVLE